MSGFIVLPKNMATKEEKAKIPKSKKSHWHYKTGRLYLHAKQLSDLLGTIPNLKKAVIEDVVFKTGRGLGSISTLSLLAMYFGVTVERCQEFNLDIIVQSPTETRREMKLSGHADKKLVNSKMKTILGPTIQATDDNELDAIALAYTNRKR